VRLCAAIFALLVTALVPEVCLANVPVVPAVALCFVVWLILVVFGSIPKLAEVSQYCQFADLVLIAILYAVSLLCNDQVSSFHAVTLNSFSVALVTLLVDIDTLTCFSQTQAKFAGASYSLTYTE